MINEKKNAKQAELDSMYNASKSKVQGEVDSAIAVLEKESALVLKKLDDQVGGFKIKARQIIWLVACLIHIYIFRPPCTREI